MEKNLDQAVSIWIARRQKLIDHVMENMDTMVRPRFLRIDNIIAELEDRIGKAVELSVMNQPVFPTQLFSGIQNKA